MNPTLWISLAFMLTRSIRMIILNLLRSNYLRDFFGCYWIPKPHSKRQCSETKRNRVWAVMNARRPLCSLLHPCEKVFDSHLTDENLRPLKVSITCMILISRTGPISNYQLQSPCTMPALRREGFYALSCIRMTSPNHL